MRPKSSALKWLLVLSLALGLLAWFFELSGVEATYLRSLLKSGFALSASLSMLMMIRRLAPEYHSLWVSNIIYIIQVLAIFVALFTTPEAGFTNRLANFTLANDLNQVLFGLLLIQFVPLAMVSAGRMVRSHKHGRPVTSLGARIRGAPPKLAFFFVLLAILLLVRPLAIANVFGGTLSYFLRVLGGMFVFAPFFVHFLAPRFRKIKKFWGVVVVILAVSGMLTGGRFMAFSPMVFYALGFIAAMPAGPRKRSLVIFAAIATVPFMSFLNVLGEIRNVHGRANVTEIDTSRVNTYVDSIGSGEHARGTQDDPSRAPVSRIINWPNCFVLTYAPSTVPYRGTDNLDRELRSMFDIGFLSGRGRAERFEELLGTAPARRFGFRVDEGTSVEYGVLADAWARGGPWTVILYGLLLILVMVGVERILDRWIWKRYPGEAMLTLMVLLNLLVLSASANPLYSVVRLLILNIVFLAVLFVFMNLAYRVVVKRGAWSP